jgi:hypothetical protein
MGDAYSYPSHVRLQQVGTQYISKNIIMKLKSTSLAIMAFSAIAAASSQGAVIFSQDFSTNNTVATYVSSTTPNSGQFNAISSSGVGTVVSVTTGVLTFARTTGNTGSYSRTSDFTTIPSAIIYKLDLTVSGNTAAQTTAAVFQVGSAFGTANAAENIADTYARFGINFGATAGEFGIRDVTNSTSSALFAGTQTITWVMNNTGSSLNYFAPTSASTALANDKADLWVGTTKILNSVAVQTTSQTITDLKFAFTAGTGTIGIDNIQITVIPEPSAALLGGLGMLALLRRRR